MIVRAARRVSEQTNVHGCHCPRKPQTARQCAPAATDRFAPMRCATPPAARQPPRPDAENVGGGVSFFNPPFTLHIIRSSRRRRRSKRNLVLRFLLGDTIRDHVHFSIPWIRGHLCPDPVRKRQFLVCIR